MRITIPTKYVIEALPKSVVLSTSFGTFQASASQDSSGVITYTRSLRITQPQIPPERYDDVVHFFAEVAQADGRQIVFKRAR